MNSVDLYQLRHELRTPLTGMLGLAELLSAQDLPDNAASWLATLQACGQQMASLIDRTLRPDFLCGDGDAHADSGIEGGVFMERLICSHWPAAMAGRTELHLLIQPQARACWRVDPVRLRQALDNLLANAIRFSPEGYVLLEACVLPSDASDVDTLLLAVENSRRSHGQLVDGKGASTIQIAYSNFTLGAEGGFDYADRSYRMFGRGQGLRVVEQVCDALHGQLQQSESSNGATRFELQLPAAVLRRAEQNKPFRLDLLRKLDCKVLLEEPVERVVIALLRGLDLPDEHIDTLEEADLYALSKNQLLICKASSLPADTLGKVDGLKSHSICLVARLIQPDKCDWFVQPLSEPLLQAELQVALLRYLVLQGMATRGSQAPVE